ncbi:hypothetical protein [Vitiosangium sp. GDMCC 1.1324]|uniref:hypothetical protein n=1 Tax=Vitiosangium sp. (strain GDMCC 1.1324) TaxID=2138576 RepID=UPI00130E1531|nr:hypothetical protein [Vitiosangium sp. GDMCC 1.1324]
MRPPLGGSSSRGSEYGFDVPELDAEVAGFRAQRLRDLMAAVPPLGSRNVRAEPMAHTA